ncbi:formate/nitrite transporter family protein [Streptomyces sp. NPDC000880]
MTNTVAATQKQARLISSGDGSPALLDPFEPHPLSVALHRAADVAMEKVPAPVAHFLRSLVGGAMVAFGVLLALSVSTGIQTPGLANLLMGLAFGFSFVLILVSSMSLITADMAAGLVAILERRMTPLQYLRFMCLGWTGNIIGAFVFVGIAAGAGGPYTSVPFLSHAYTVGLAKSGTSNFSTFLLALICTWFLQTAMFMFFKARTDIARMSFAFYGPFAFVIGMTQHVIANVGFISFPLLLEFAHPSGALPDVATSLSWGMGDHGLLRNLLWATLGNLVGGTVFVAGPFWLIATMEKRHTGVAATRNA